MQQSESLRPGTRVCRHPSEDLALKYTKLRRWCLCLHIVPLTRSLTDPEGNDLTHHDVRGGKRCGTALRRLPTHRLSQRAPPNF